MRQLKKILENINLILYDSKDTAYRVIDTVSPIITFLGIISLTYFYGFDLNNDLKDILLIVFKGIIGFFIIKNLFIAIYSLSIKQHIKENLIRYSYIFIVIIFIIFEVIFNIEIIKIIGEITELSNFENYKIIFIQIFLFLFISFEVLDISSRILLSKINPSALLVLSFILLIIIGTAILMMPEMTTIKKSLDFSDALFTSISASCVTGLTVIDTSLDFSLKGKLVIMILIQLGGINIISFAALFISFSGNRSMKHMFVIQKNLDSQSVKESKNLLKKIFLFSFTIEAIGTILIFILLKDKIPENNIFNTIFDSMFHSLSAFNNAGFSNIPNGLMNYNIQDNYALQIVIAILIILGGIGFFVINELISIKTFKKFIFISFWKKLSLNTRVILVSYLLLISIGTIVFLLLEYNSTLSDKGIFDKIISSFFHSVSSRTAGFNTLEIGELTTSTLIFTILLMFIGAGPVSTGGGIKITTFAIIIMSAYSTIMNKDNVEINHQYISKKSILKAFMIFLFSIFFVFICTFLLSLTEKNIDIIRLCFEEVSAFATVGLSTGISNELSIYGKTIIMLSMFIGRVGLLTLAFSLNNRKEKTYKYKYTEGKILL